MISGFFPSAPYGSVAHSVLGTSTESSAGPGSGLINCAISFFGTADTIPSYDVGDIVIIFATFSDPVFAALIDPSALAFRLKDPAGIVDNSIVPVHVSTGVFSVELTAALSGMWRFTFSALGVSEDGQFVVSSSLSD